MMTLCHPEEKSGPEKRQQKANFTLRPAKQRQDEAKESIKYARAAKIEKVITASE